MRERPKRYQRVDKSSCFEGVMNSTEDTDRKGCDDDDDDDDGCGVRQLDTIELSVGSETIKFLDNYAFALEKGYENAVARLRHEKHPPQPPN